MMTSVALMIAVASSSLASVALSPHQLHKRHKFISIQVGNRTEPHLGLAPGNRVISTIGSLLRRAIRHARVGAAEEVDHVRAPRVDDRSSGTSGNIVETSASEREAFGSE